MEQLGLTCVAILDAIDSPLALLGGGAPFFNRAWRQSVESATCPLLASVSAATSLDELQRTWASQGSEPLTRVAQALRAMTSGTAESFDGPCSCAEGQTVVRLRRVERGGDPACLITHSVPVEGTERELSQLDHLSAPPSTVTTAGAFGLQSLKEGTPDHFARLCEEYGELLALALEERSFRVSHSLRDRLRQYADGLAFLNAGPRDLVEIHGAALRSRTRNVNRAKSLAYADEGRVLLIEVMGLMAANYRNRGAGPRPPMPPRRGFHGPSAG